MRVFIAGPWADRDAIREIAKEFVAAGIEVGHRWWDVEDTAGTYLQDDDPNAPFYEEQAMGDFYGVVGADAFVLVNNQPQGRESTGKAVETGIAIAFQKPVIVIGRRSNLYHYMGNVQIVDSADEAIALLKD